MQIASQLAATITSQPAISSTFSAADGPGFHEALLAATTRGDTPGKSTGAGNGEAPGKITVTAANGRTSGVSRAPATSQGAAQTKPAASGNSAASIAAPVASPAPGAAAPVSTQAAGVAAPSKDETAGDPANVPVAPPVAVQAAPTAGPADTATTMAAFTRARMPGPAAPAAPAADKKSKSTLASTDPSSGPLQASADLLANTALSVQLAGPPDPLPSAPVSEQQAAPQTLAVAVAAGAETTLLPVSSQSVSQGVIQSVSQGASQPTPASALSANLPSANTVPVEATSPNTVPVQATPDKMPLAHGPAATTVPSNIALASTASPGPAPIVTVPGNALLAKTTKSVTAPTAAAPAATTPVNPAETTAAPVNGVPAAAAPADTALLNANSMSTAPVDTNPTAPAANLPSPPATQAQTAGAAAVPAQTLPLSAPTSLPANVSSLPGNDLRAGQEASPAPATSQGSAAATGKKSAAGISATPLSGPSLAPAAATPQGVATSSITLGQSSTGQIQREDLSSPGTAASAAGRDRSVGEVRGKRKENTTDGAATESDSTAVAPTLVPSKAADAQTPTQGDANDARSTDPAAFQRVLDGSQALTAMNVSAPMQAGLPSTAAAPGATPPQSVPVPLAGASADTTMSPSVSSAQLIQSAGQSEMRVGMRSAEFGNISISTSVNHQALSAQISTDHSELGRALAVHLPAIEEKLGAAYGLHARVEVRDESAASRSAADSGHYGGGAQEQTGGARGGQSRSGAEAAPGNYMAGVNVGPSSSAISGSSSDAPVAGSRLDIRI